MQNKYFGKRGFNFEIIEFARLAQRTPTAVEITTPACMYLAIQTLMLQ